MKILISADSTCDLSKDLQQKYNISIMPIIVTLGDKEYEDGVNITQEQLYSHINSTGILAKTAARSAFEYQEHFEKLLKECDHVIHFSLSFRISATGNNALSAAQELGEDKVTVIDTKSLSSGSALLILSTAEKIMAGKDLETIKSEVLAEVNQVQASFLVDTLKYLHKGGRCSGVALLGANLLKIKPRISLVNGEMKVTKKYMGNINSSLLKYVKDILAECPPNKKRVFVTSSSPMEIKAKIAETLKDYGFEEIIEADAGCTICTHCGKNTLGILYMAE